MVNELKPCAHCGGEAEEWVCPFEDTGYIRCTECEARTRQTLTREEATEEWNTRADTARLSELEAAVARLRSALEDIRSQAGRHYCRSLDQFSKTECLGWEAKVRTGVFGKPEFEAHAEANLRMGRHQGMMEAVKRIASALEAQS